MSQAYKKHRKKPMKLRMTMQFETIARLLLLGWTAKTIARRLHCNVERVRYTIAKPEFEAIALALPRENMRALGKRINWLLFAAVKSLTRNFRSDNWRCRANAVEQILKMHDRFLERLDVTGQIDHAGQVTHQHGLVLGEREMSDEERQLVHRLLALRKQFLPGAAGNGRDLTPPRPA
jgi:hypothetical protein